MNRRDFFSKASLAVAGIAAACGMLPELAKAEVPLTDEQKHPMLYADTFDPFDGINFPPWDTEYVGFRPKLGPSRSAGASPAQWRRIAASPTRS